MSNLWYLFRLSCRFVIVRMILILSFVILYMFKLWILMKRFLMFFTLVYRSSMAKSLRLRMFWNTLHRTSKKLTRHYKACLKSVFGRNIIDNSIYTRLQTYIQLHNQSYFNNKRNSNFRFPRIYRNCSRACVLLLFHELHHEVKPGVRRCLWLWPSRSFGDLDGSETLIFVKFSGS